MGKKTILVVDDKENIRSLLEVFLTEIGYSIITCEDGKDAVQHINRADLIITDFNMPRMNGVELTKIAKREKPGMPVIIMTGEPEKVVPIGYMANQIIEKPFSLELMQEIIARFWK